MARRGIELVKRVVIDGIPFKAEIHYGGWRSHGVWDKNFIWVQASPEFSNQVIARIEKTVKKGKSKGFRLIQGGEEVTVDHWLADSSFHSGCDRCEDELTLDAPEAIAQKFRDALKLPKDSEIEVYATLLLGTRLAGKPRTMESGLTLTPYECQQFCVLHGTALRNGAESTD